MDWVHTDTKHRTEHNLAEGLALVATCVAAGLFRRFLGQRQCLHKKDGK